MGFCTSWHPAPMTRRLRASSDVPAATSGPAHTTQAPDPEAWSLARLYANGDTRRLVVLDPHTVLVRNRPE